jgi:UTP--glucose-1-phosphate uridylyltransferase
MVRDISGGIHFSYTRQSEALGLGHAVLLARDLVGDEPFAVLLSDVIHDGPKPATKSLIDAYEKNGHASIVVEKVPKDRVQFYGIVDIDSAAGSETPGQFLKIRDVVEKPKPEEAPSDLAVTGRYVLPPEIFDYLEKTAPGSGGEIQLTDALRMLAKDAGLWAYIYDGKTYDAGDKLGFLQATVELALKNPSFGEAFRSYLKTVKL